MAAGVSSGAPNSNKELVHHLLVFKHLVVETNEDPTWNFRNTKAVRQRQVKAARVNMRISVHRTAIPAKVDSATYMTIPNKSIGHWLISRMLERNSK